MKSKRDEMNDADEAHGNMRAQPTTMKLRLNA